MPAYTADGWLCFALLKGPPTHKSKAGAAPYKRTVRKGNQQKANGTVFKVSLPLTEGSVLLQRTSFSRDRVPVSTAYEPPSPSESPICHWTGTEVQPDEELHRYEEEQEEAGVPEYPCGEAAEGNQEAEGGFVHVVQPDSLRVANVLSSLVTHEGIDNGSEERQNWRTAQTVWLDRSDGSGGLLPRSYSEPSVDDPWSSRPGTSSGPSVGVSNYHNLGNTTSPAWHDYQQYQYLALGSVQEAAPCSHAASINAPLPFGGPLAATGGTAAEPQPADYNHQWRSVVSSMPFGQY